MFMKSWPIFYSKFLYKVGQDFLDIQHAQEVLSIFFIVTHNIKWTRLLGQKVFLQIVIHSKGSLHYRLRFLVFSFVKHVPLFHPNSRTVYNVCLQFQVCLLCRPNWNHGLEAATAVISQFQSREICKIIIKGRNLSKSVIYSYTQMKEQSVGSKWYVYSRAREY